jgi:hypothetical protein
MYHSSSNDIYTISLILFTDGATFNRQTSAWAMFGIIADLDPIIRNSYENIITFYMLGTSKPRLNLFCGKYLKNFERILKSGLRIDSIGHVNLRIIGFIGDSQAIPKVLNSKQYNGACGCIHCLVEGVQTSKGLRVYPYSSNILLRNDTLYRGQVALAKITKKECHGIKGSCWLSKFIEIPENILLDYMHVCCIGTMEKQVELWDLSN